MDLGQIKRGIEAGKYSNIEQAANDIRLVWSNCMLYNRDGSEVTNIHINIVYIFIHITYFLLLYPFILVLPCRQLFLDEFRGNVLYSQTRD